MESYNTVIFGNFMQPLTHAVYQLVRKDRDSVSWKVNEGDSDWIYTGILLCVVMLENSWRWTKLHVSSGDPSIEALKYYDELRCANPTLPDVAELFVLRDILAHGHLWAVPIPLGNNGVPIAHRIAGYENARWRNVVDISTQRTKALALHVVPSLMDRSDLKKVLERTVGAWRELVRLNLLLPQSLNRSLIWPDGSGRRISILNLAEEIQ